LSLPPIRPSGVASRSGLRVCARRSAKGSGRQSPVARGRWLRRSWSAARPGSTSR
jgi:hypothetical protein